VLDRKRIVIDLEVFEQPINNRQTVDCQEGLVLWGETSSGVGSYPY
jgi:hypothetical protein